MGQDYSYSQPSSSSESVDITSLLEAEAQIYADEADSSYCNAMPVQYPRQPEADDGIPTTCYCGAQPVLGCSYTYKDPYRSLNRFGVSDCARNCCKGFKREWRPSGFSVTSTLVVFEMKWCPMCR
ncbi:hypothetical protein Bca52824_021778 [Brassica carinata]|uniref:Uncharacterized protein n=1 Tax=Brassica carinata TaxID=52824 RepID=A0A8X7VFE1_BRACI|nr:hypothetical protein Bca52824_021778 [Brassica carinata]